MRKISLYAKRSTGNAPGEPPPPPPPSSDVVMHPGWYWLPSYNSNGTIASESTYFSEVNSSLYGWRGAQLRFDWPTLEPTQGNYSFNLPAGNAANKLVQALNKINSGKYLFILFEVRSSGGANSPHVVPDYMLSPAEGGTDAAGIYGGGDVAYRPPGSSQTTRKGYMAVLWNAKVQERLNALIDALGVFFANNALHNAKLEGCGATESSIGDPMPGYKDPVSGSPSFNKAGYILGLKGMIQRWNVAFPSKVNYQFMNYPYDLMADIIPNFPTWKNCLASPDIFVNEPGLNKLTNPQGLYEYYRDLKGQIPLMCSIQPQDMQGDRPPFSDAGKPTRMPSFTELRNYAINDLGANYICWQRTVADFSHAGYQSTAPYYVAGSGWQYWKGSPAYINTGFQYWQETLNFMSQAAQKSTPSGGCITTIPSCYL